MKWIATYGGPSAHAAGDEIPDEEIVEVEDVPGLVQERIRDGYLYGDFQFKTDERADDFPDEQQQHEEAPAEQVPVLAPCQPPGRP